MRLAATILTVVGLSIICFAAEAAEGCHPIPAEEIEKQWAYYNSLVDAQPSGGNDKYECIAIEKSKQIVCRTTAANPAHPSIVIRSVTQDGAGVLLRTEADTAGRCDAFLRMMEDYKALDAQTREKMSHQK
jgi:hypothetical protein